MENNSYPVSIEIFAAYMDGNLSADEMQNIESLINNNNSLCKIKFVYEGIEPDLNTPIDNEYIEAVSSKDFKLPEITKEEILDNSDNIGYIDTDESEEVEEFESNYQNHEDIDLDPEDEDSLEDGNEEDDEDNSPNSLGEDDELDEEEFNEDL